MRSKTYRIDIPPLAWKRADLNGQRFFDGQTKDKVIFGLTMNKYHEGEKPFTTAIDFDVIFFMPIPKTRTKYKEGQPCIGRSDLDNLLKFLFDAAVDAGIISDDNIICSIVTKKIYSKTPRTEFKITEII